ncbi:MAG: hypothetical protein Q9220_004089 [cf. Caloplaca sp. 1 TL-2023]
MKRSLVDEALQEAKVMGVKNILALRGDPPREEEYRLDTENGNDEEEEEEEGAEDSETFEWAIDLVRYIRRKHGDFFCIGVAAYPEGHSDESHPQEQNYDRDLPYLVEKVRAGAEFLVTQFFFDVNHYTRFEKVLRGHESGVFRDIPIIPGLLPIQNYQILRRTAKLAHCRIPPGLLESLGPIKADDEEVKRKGVDFLCGMIEEIKATKSSKPRGFHFYTLNLEKVVASVMDRSNLTTSAPLIPYNFDVGIDDSSPMPNGINGSSSHSTNGLPCHKVPTLSSSRRPSISSNHLIISDRSSSPSQPTHLSTNQSINPGSREASWDDYPNGRFGDARSPAFGTPTSYSPSSLPCTPSLARTLWGEPTNPAAVTALFTSYLSGNGPSLLPWSDDSSPALSPETAFIRDDLLFLTTTRNWWTIASQPAVDGLPSTDPIHGWGPAKGFVFQKPFVELFCPVMDWYHILRPHLQSKDAAAEVSWYAGTPSGGFESSDESSDAVHAVTWGSFLGKEITTATMVEEVNFRAWCEEAFGRWEEWARCCRKVEARAFLRRRKGDMVLINVIGHAYRGGEGEGLWRTLREAAGRGDKANGRGQ